MTLPEPIADLLADIQPVAPRAADDAHDRHATLVKPPGSLGRLEDLGARLAAITGACPPPVPERPAVVVAAADHGVHAQGVTRWPQITAMMVEPFCAGTAAVNAIARAVGAGVAVHKRQVVRPRWTCITPTSATRWACSRRWAAWSTPRWRV